MTKDEILAALESAERYGKQCEWLDKASAAYWHLRGTLLDYVNSPNHE